MVRTIHFKSTLFPSCGPVWGVLPIPGEFISRKLGTNIKNFKVGTFPFPATLSIYAACKDRIKPPIVRRFQLARIHLSTENAIALAKSNLPVPAAEYHL